MKQTLRDPDLAIAQRLREFRKSLLIPRTALALRLGVSTDRFTGYERARAPLRTDVAVKLWREFKLSPKWLATGEGDVYLECDGFVPLIESLEGREVFSRAWDERMAAEVEEGIAHMNALRSRTDQVLQSLRDRGLSDARFSRMGKNFLAGLIRRMIEAGSEQKAALDTINERFKSGAAVKPTPRFPKLLARVRALTNGYGAKKRLADFLGVSSQQLHKWLNGLAEPGGETTLRLLEWVTFAEAQQKEAGRVAARPARKTQAKPHRETKQSTGPPPD